MTTEAIVFLVTAIVLPLLLTEFGDWCPSLAKRLAQWTARRLGASEATERYSEEWTAELEHLPGKLAPLFVALSYFTALPRIRRSLRTARRVGIPARGLDQLVPTRIPVHRDFYLAMHPWMFQAQACSTLLNAILDENPCNRNRLHLLLGPTGSGKSMIALWLSESLAQEGKEVHHILADDWANRSNPLHVSPQLRDQLVQAAQEVGLLVVDNVDYATLEALEALRLPCPVLMITQVVRALGTSEELTRGPSNRGITVDLAPEWGSFRSGAGVPGRLPPVAGRP